MLRRVKRTLMSLATIAVAVWLYNTSVFTAPPEDGATLLLSHRGVHQRVDGTGGIGAQECTANRIYEPTHELIENTIPSIRAAFEAGADVVEIDVRRTKDGHFAVFHDWEVACRTNGAGRVETLTRAELKALDIGYGYTTDGGTTYPLRGLHIGAMPMLNEVMDAFPEGRFLVNLKGNNTPEGEAFADFIQSEAGWSDQVFAFYGGPRTVAAAAAALPDHKSFTTARTRACVKDYALTGWTGRVPERCRNTQILLPINYARYLWGWPHKFTLRMKAAGTEVYLAGIYPHDAHGSQAIDSTDLLERVPKGFDGLIWTEKVEEIGPLLAEPE